MRPLVVLFAVISAAVAAPHPVADHIQKRSIGHAVAYTVPSAVSHQSRVDVRSSPVLATAVVEPLAYAPATVYAAPASKVYVGGSAVSHQSRVDVQHTPAVVTEVHAPAVVAEPAVVEARAVYAPQAAVYAAPQAAVFAAPQATVYAGGSAVSHQSRVDVQSSPAVVTQQVLAPAVVDARSVWAPSVYASVW